ncbi:MAG: hypothetical protein KF802_10195 [Bdellovibrionaceae bacterium]|nr:hypothetical protein [Pseudobdellovibrionaceae bacterium]MBX3033782.1 hypothetical protein [Pseudobdellovibrionaceae bacterium]
MKTTFLRLFVLCFFAIGGFSLVFFSTDRFQIARDPAAIRQVYDFSHLRGSALDVAMKERLIAGIEVDRQTDRVGLGMGHFAFVNASGEKTLGCREFGKVAMRFEAEGMVVNGERPAMEVEGACEFSDDLARVSPLYIPVARILGEKPADGEFQFRDGKEITVRFANLSDEWPRKWVLVSVRMMGSRAHFNIDRNDLNKVLGHPFLVNLE